MGIIQDIHDDLEKGAAQLVAEYRERLAVVIDDPALPVVCNVNVGHALPRCVVPFGVEAVVDADRQRITFAP